MDVDHVVAELTVEFVRQHIGSGMKNVTHPEIIKECVAKAEEIAEAMKVFLDERKQLAEAKAAAELEAEMAAMHRARLEADAAKNAPTAQP